MHSHVYGQCTFPRICSLDLTCSPAYCLLHHPRSQYSTRHRSISACVIVCPRYFRQTRCRPATKKTFGAIQPRRSGVTSGLDREIPVRRLIRRKLIALNTEGSNAFPHRAPLLLLAVGAIFLLDRVHYVYYTLSTRTQPLRRLPPQCLA